jgi:hypothetical protein
MGVGGAQSILATGEDADITQEGLHRVDPLIMEAAWVRPDFDLSGYTRILLMPTAVQFRDVPERSNDARTRAMREYFPVEDERKEWMRRTWREALEARFSQDSRIEGFQGETANVLAVQVLIADVVSRIPPYGVVGSTVSYVGDPWSASLVLELRDATTAQLLARTLDRRNTRGLMDVGEVWHRTEDLLQRWAQVMDERLSQLSELGGRDATMPEWAR